MINKSYAELISAEPDTLTDEELGRRIRLTELKERERNLELVESQNTKFQEEKAEKKRVADSKTVIIEQENERLNRERSICKHKSGGKGLPGFFNGDGKQGYSVATQQLPTKETYFICFRCQKEWHQPSKRVVIDAYKKSAALGREALAKYRKEEAEYFTVASWDKPLFETDSGTTPGSTLFLIPRLEEQKVKDDTEFAALMDEIDGSKLAVAR